MGAEEWLILGPVPVGMKGNKASRLSGPIGGERTSRKEPSSCCSHCLPFLWYLLAILVASLPPASYLALDLALALVGGEP